MLLPKLDVGGVVLAGGQSSRMGRDKALLQLAGKPLIEHAVTKLRRVTRQVRISSANDALGAYAPLIADLHSGCGPIGGMEAALLSARYEWSLFLPVDVPFLPTIYLYAWIEFMDSARLRGVRAMIWTLDGVPQPTIALVHRDVAPYLSAAIERGEYKLRPALQRAANQAAMRSGFEDAAGFCLLPYWSEMRAEAAVSPVESWHSRSEAQNRYREHWFDNLNTPGEFAEAERHVNALDT